jgi:peptidoglycan/xylan/chitin deacetylase (PgdA/CDA1 family)
MKDFSRVYLITYLIKVREKCGGRHNMKKWFLLSLFLLLGCREQTLPVSQVNPVSPVKNETEAVFAEKTPSFEVTRYVYEADMAQQTESAAYPAPSRETAAPPPAELLSEKREVRIPVLNYHSIGIDPGNPAVITPQKFEEQMKYLKTENYTALRIQDFKDIWEGKKQAPLKPVLITFDDGYTDNYEQAMPILQKYAFHATLFLITGWTDKEGYLNWDQVKEMQQAGWDIMPHSMSHPHLPRLSLEKQKLEIVESRKLIEEKLGGVADVFCYPYGEYNQRTLNLLKENKFQYAFTIQQGHASSSENPLLIKRLFIHGGENMDAFKKKLSKS